RLSFLIGMPGILQHPAGGPCRNANLEIAGFATRKNADALGQMSFQVEVGRPLKELVERFGPQKSVELQMPDALLSGRDFMSRGHDVEAALVEDDGIGLDLPRLRIFAGRLIFGFYDAPLQDGPVER